MNKKQINIGLDIGITSVGYSIIDEDNNILKMGVRLFDDPASSKDGKLDNEKRRESRSKRRNISRTRNRKDDFIKKLLKWKWYESQQQIQNVLKYDILKYDAKNPIDLKIKALNQKVSKDELVIILFHYLKHRGFFHITEEMLKDETLLLPEKKFIYPSIAIKNFDDENNYYKDSKIVKNIPNSDYVKEIEKIFDVQNIDENIKNEFVELFVTRRDFAQGPGSKKSPTPYGLWRVENGKLIEIGKNLWDISIGKCTYCENLRAAKNSPYAELFNLLNDLSIIYFNQDKKEKLSLENKKQIFYEIADSLNKKHKNKKVNLKFIKTVVNKNILESNISGFRSDNKNKPLFTELTSLSKIVIFLLDLKIIKEFDFYNLEQLELINNLYEKLRKNPADAQKRIDTLNTEFPNNFEANQKLVKDLKSLSQNHSLCNNDLVEFIKFSLGLSPESNEENTNDNQMVYFNNKGRESNDLSIFKNRKYVPENLLESKEFKDQVIMAPTAKRAYNQAIKVFNAIIKTYANDFEINNVSIEMARDKNTAEQRKSIEKMQKKNKEFEEKLKKEFNFDINDSNIPKKSNLRTKLKLYIEQDKVDIYDNKIIDLADLIRNPNNYNVDHIIPYSVCFIDGFVNKVLTKNSLNSQKGKKTPWQWLSTKENQFEEFEKRVNQIYKDQKSKREILLFKGDPGQNLEAFIERNLVDTRYATKLVLNILTGFFKENKDKYNSAKIKSINGGQTNYARYNYFHLKKDRDDYSHHAIDAMIINFLGSDYEFNLLTKHQEDDNLEIGIKFDKNSKHFYNLQTGEIVDVNSEEQINLIKNQKIKTLKEQLLNLEKENKILFSRRVVSKNNPPLSNETIYSIKWDDATKSSGKLISKLNIITTKTADLVKYFDSEIREKAFYESLVCFHKDPTLYQLLYDIFNENKESGQNIKVNPFITYFNKMQPDESETKTPKVIKIVNKKNQVFLIRNLKREIDQKSEEDLISLKKHNNNAVMQSLEWKEIRIYQNNKNGFLTIPINQKKLCYSKDEKKWIVDEQKIAKILKEKNIENQKYLLLKRGSLFINKKDKKLFYVIGGNFNQNKIDLKCLNHSNTYNNYFPGNRMQIAFSTIAKEYDICQSDVLGNIYNRQDIFEFFKKK